ncbi:MAG: zinc dependent phospholipase C family protein, partial [bacterium]
FGQAALRQTQEEITLKAWLVGPLLALAVLILFPAPLHAWTPGTHIFLGESVLANLSSLPGAVADLLRAFPFDFLYGNIAADSSIAKKYAPVGRHCHAWHVGQEIHDLARTDALRAFGLGYLSHLAADVVAHNYFVPRQLVLTSSTTGFGHSYWESRFETHLGAECARHARELILIDHSRSDGLLDRVLSPTIFSTPTNRRIFRGMVYVADTESWQRIFHLVEEKSRWDLTEQEVGGYMIRAFDFIVDLMTRLDRAEPYKLDPAGTMPLREAKRVRRAALRRGGEDHVLEQAQNHFGMPPSKLQYAVKLPEPLYPPRTDNN